ncbi:MAG: globin [Thiohalorhabdus sp.]|uniref:globin n=1 Tax=Thiohalorhabdus sp. TaxID=3094134 RepID=UPI00397FC1B4
MQTNPVDRVKRSLGRSLHQGDVFDTFYRIFLDSDPRIREQFTETDWEEQKRLLRQGVNNVIGFYEGSATGRSALSRIRQTHCRERMDISPELYDYWVESMIKAVQRLDPDFDPTLEQSWRDVLRYGTEFVKAGYEQ